MPESIGPLSNTFNPTAVSTVDAVFGRHMTGDVTTLNEHSAWLPLWAGEVIYAYDKYRIFENYVMDRTLGQGETSIRFPLTGTVDIKSAHQAGEELMGGGPSNNNYFTIKLDERPVVAHFELDDVDQLNTQVEMRAELSRQAGLALANHRDQQLAQVIIRGAHSASRRPVDATYPGFNVGINANYAGFIKDDALYNPILKAAIGTATEAQLTAAALQILKDINTYLIRLQDNDVDTMGLTCVVRPAVFAAMRTLGVPSTVAELGVKTPFFGGIAEQGGLGKSLTELQSLGEPPLVYQGVTIVKTNRLPGDAVNLVGTAVAGQASAGEMDSNYIGDFRDTAAVIFKSDAVTSLTRVGINVETYRDVRRGTNFTKAAFYKGAGVLKPEVCCVLEGTTNAATIDWTAIGLVD